MSNVFIVFKFKKNNRQIFLLPFVKKGKNVELLKLPHISFVQISRPDSNGVGTRK